MAVDFVDAAYRCWEDAELLSQQQRHATADHLYGVSAECALKALLIEAGTQALTLVNGDLQKKYRLHLPKVWDEFSRFSMGFPVRYSMSLGPNPFRAWSVDQRYLSRTDVIADAARLNAHKQAARKTLAVLESARLDGRL